MGTLTTEVYDALIEAGASEEKARAAAEAIGVRSSDLATKEFVRAELATLENRLFGKMVITIIAVNGLLLALLKYL